MPEEFRIQALRSYLMADAQARLDAPPVRPIAFTNEEATNLLLSDFDNTPHAFVLACMASRRISGDRAFILPGRLKDRLNRFDLPFLAQLPQDVLDEAMSEPYPLHWDPIGLARSIGAAFRRIADVYAGDAARIWNGTPPSAAIVRRFLEFDGVGPKIATMAANILVRDFRIPVSDRYSIDISVDRHVQNVFERLGFVPSGAKRETIVYRARELWPEYPGIFDYAVWEIGRAYCHSMQPTCTKCPLRQHCLYPANSTRASISECSQSSTIDS